MTVPQFETYTPPVFDEGDAYRAVDNIGHSCIISVREHKPSVVTANSPDGAPAVIVDLVDLDTPGGPRVFRNVLMMTGAIVDGFKAHTGSGKPLVVAWEKRVAKSGRPYAAPVPAPQDAYTRAGTYYQQNGDPFAPTFNTVSTTTGDAQPPF